MKPRYNDMILSDNDVKRFRSKINVKDENNCWEWEAGLTNKGYGVFWANGVQLYAHRVAYYLENNIIDCSLCVCHICDNPKCCNPKHLFLGTHQDNASDKVSKGRAHGGYNPGEKCPVHKLTEKQVLEIRSKYIPKVYSTHKLAKEYGISSGQIGRIIRREEWNHI